MTASGAMLGRRGTRGLDVLEELLELGQAGEGIFHTVVDLQKPDERLAVGEQAGPVADPLGLRIVERREHLLRRRLNTGDALGLDLGLDHVHGHVLFLRAWLKTSSASKTRQQPRL